ncbi:MAG: glutathione S-transferase family protein [Rhodospirillales bacterium]|nr:glutathione S-transferase family protein [Rhodospirillales bacterium]
MAKLEIYGIPQSSYVRTARMAAIEKGVDYDLIPVLPHSDELLEISLYGKVPAMRHGDVSLCETLAITSYIDDVFDGPALVPSDRVEKAQMYSWISAIIDHFYDAMVRRYILQVFFPKGPDGAPDETVTGPALEQIKRQLSAVNKAMLGNRFLVGNQLTLADLYIAPIFSYLGNMPHGEELFADCPNIRGATPNMHERQSYKETQPPAPE